MKRPIDATGARPAPGGQRDHGSMQVEAGRLRLDDQLCFALYAATNAVTRAYRPLLAGLDLTYPQYLVMLVLWQDGPSASRAIADRLQLPANAVSPLIDRLEAAGLVERKRESGDRRVVPIHLTQRGMALEGAAATAQGAVVCRTGLDPDALGRLRQDLHALADRLGQEAAAAAASQDDLHRGGGSEPAMATAAEGPSARR